MAKIKKMPSKRGSRELFGLCLVLFVLGLLTPLHFMVKYHPYQNVYFNVLAGKRVTEKFDMDYWGLSYKEALEYILRHDALCDVPVTISSTSKDGYFKILKKEDRERIRNVPVAEARYFVSNFRSPQNFYAFKEKRFPFMHEIFSVSVNSHKIVGVYKLQ